MDAQPGQPCDILPGNYYSNGAYGRSWGVRQVLTLTDDEVSGGGSISFRGVAGTCRRKKGTCSLDEFRAWARYEVALNENSWQRVGYFEEAWPEQES